VVSECISLVILLGGRLSVCVSTSSDIGFLIIMRIVSRVSRGLEGRFVRFSCLGLGFILFISWDLVVLVGADEVVWLGGGGGVWLVMRFEFSGVLILIGLCVCR